MRWALVVAFSMALGGCSALHQPGCSGGERTAIQDSLYFGTGKPNGAVTPDEWTAFLAATVTPRFPQGLTVSQAAGQWRGANGAIVRESTHVLQLIHPNDSASEQAITEIVSAYKTQFQQEAVLRVKAGACVTL